MFFAATAALPEAPTLPTLYAACLGAVALFGGALAVLLALAVWPRAVRSCPSGQPRSPRPAPRRSPRRARPRRRLRPRRPALAALADRLFLLVTLAYWAANALGMWVLARGCGLELGLAEAVAVLAVLNLTLLVPGPPAHVGTFQLGVLTGLALFLPPPPSSPAASSTPSTSTSVRSA
jgi:uncharacterized membrane protein YbhN (UPF0104 family)